MAFLVNLVQTLLTRTNYVENKPNDLATFQCYVSSHQWGRGRERKVEVEEEAGVGLERVKMAEEQLGVGLKKEREEKPSTETTMMTPWEQHSAVISIPRFDYNAPSSLLDHSHSGFLITCTIKREKSATKEAMSILSKNRVTTTLHELVKTDLIRIYLHKKDYFLDTRPCNIDTIYLKFLQYIMSLSGSSSPSVETLDANTSLKRRKICFKEIGVECCNAIEKTESANSGNNCSTAGNGITNTSDDLDICTAPLDSSFMWCHRIFPIQATCKLNEETLHAVVSKLVHQIVDNNQNTFEKPIKVPFLLFYCICATT
ncbi:hypothetical protein GIB67_006260 [Kingdonia uniflora]|uniref:Uncharacterized protein n=1 Tax=Kingdonia uniflora TaxID=39325 RepID=A0A7J7P601_9MAGN|nr:hypothetical protein GIB67_006260 [Kingdonia uniflora]